MSGDIPQANTTSILDKIRHDEGIEKLKAYFKALAKKDRNRAIELINEKTLNFSSLFALRNEIKESGLYGYLNTRNSNALEATDTMLTRKSLNIRSMPQDSRQTTYSSLRWMLNVESRDEITDKQLEEVVDTAALLLVKSYKDKAVLPKVVNQIFDRYNRNAYTYDLIWACFESCSPQVLYMIANRLLSSRMKDVELSTKLLSFIPCPGINGNVDRTQYYSCCMNWINENYPFLYYTGESFQQSCKPIPFAVSLEAKYLCKAVSPDNGKISGPLTKDELELLRIFNTLDDYTKVLLSTCSFRLYRKNFPLWSRWRYLPVWQQIQGAMRMGGWLL